MILMTAELGLSRVMDVKGSDF